MDQIETDAPSEDDVRWQAVQRRDAGADGSFWYSVATTGVYCRPTCRSRLPLRRNVAFHSSTEAAERAGFRPCRRCRPDQAAVPDETGRLIAAACASLDQAIDDGLPTPTLAALAAAAGRSPFHFQRMFKRRIGLTPAQYAAARRGETLREGLESGASVTDSIYDAGYGSSSRYYETADAVLGMTATEWRRLGAGTVIRFAVGQSSLGVILVAATAKGVCAIQLGDDPQALVERLQDRFSAATLIGADPDFEAVIARIVGYVERPLGGLDLALDLDGTLFQRRVWQALRAIPAGDRVSYAEIARRIGMPTASRAVAQACGANPLAVAIPCHRVVRSDGSLSGYRWGVERKQALLDREAALAAG